ncbi:OmpH family outer membrane protein [candidate division WOR-3 bacterium]|uniref:OmpH family outer membrane protein n=1 Tax=candidate division WOR-3 bacterium TaxID=2052148 RepID=A0A937XHU5_UNCW3|nr:OmpH family outer membrane protein [candidate division WOR-3 bacterium]
MRTIRLAIILGLAASGPLLTAKEFRIGYVDYDQVIAKYQAAVDAKSEMDTVRLSFEAQAESLQGEWEQSKAEYESQQLTLSEEGKRAKNAEVDQRKRRYDGYIAEVYGKGGLIDQRYKELIAPIVGRIDSAVAKLSADEGFALILDASKSGIVYSEAGLDLTQLVIEDLNREFAPVGPSVTGTKVYALMPVFNSNDQAAQDRVGTSIRDFVYKLVSAQPNVDMVANAKVDQQLQSRGLSNQQVVLDKALEAGRALDADYVIFGNASKQDKRIQFELSIAEARLGTLLKTQKGDAVRPEDLQVQVGTVVRVLLAAVEKP